MTDTNLTLRVFKYSESFAQGSDKRRSHVTGSVSLPDGLMRASALVRRVKA